VGKIKKGPEHKEKAKKVKPLGGQKESPRVCPNEGVGEDNKKKGTGMNSEKNWGQD